MDLDSFKPIVIDETEKLLQLVQVEYGVPPSFAVLYINYYLTANIIASYKRADKKPPKELVSYLDKTHKKLMDENLSTIQAQYLHLNTEGSC